MPKGIPKSLVVAVLSPPASISWWDLRQSNPIGLPFVRADNGRHGHEPSTCDLRLFQPVAFSGILLPRTRCGRQRHGRREERMRSYWA